MSDLQKKPEEAREIARVKLGLISCFVLLGLCIGLFSGLSQSPISATIIPLLFALLTGGAGLSVAKADLSNRSDRARISVTGVSIAAFAAACLASAVYGILVRSGASVRSLIPGYAFAENRSVALPTDLTNSIDTIAMGVGLRRRLELLGATRTETQLALERFATMSRQHLQGDALRGELVSVQKTAHRLFEASIAVAKGLRTHPSAEGHEGTDKFDEITVALRSLDERISSWIRVLDLGGQLNPYDLRAAANDYNEGVGDLLTRYGDRRELSSMLAGTQLSVADLAGLDTQLVSLASGADYLHDMGDLLAEMDKGIKLGVDESENGKTWRHQPDHEPGINGPSMNDRRGGRSR